MALIAPRRGEVIVDGRGFMTRRFQEYLEENSGTVNTISTDSEVDPSSINLSAGVNAQQTRRIENIEVDTFASVKTTDQTNDIISLVYAMQAQIFQLQKRITELETIHG